MRRYFAITGLCFFLIFALVSLVFCEEMTITTYYPSPHGVYKTLRLFPNTDHASGDACSSPGEMFYHSTANQVLVCDGSTNTWRQMGGGPVATGLYGSCYHVWSGPMVPWCSPTTVSPAYCTSGYCACPSGYTSVVTGTELSGGNLIQYKSCYKN